MGDLDCGPDGICETVGLCSFPDLACLETGRRFSAFAGDFSGQCVGTAPLTDADPGDGAPQGDADPRNDAAPDPADAPETFDAPPPDAPPECSGPTQTTFWAVPTTTVAPNGFTNPDRIFASDDSW